jgi:omega-6 fatty acid desaturase (delta-12 desaturase)
MAPSWFPLTKEFEKPSRRKAVIQLINTLVPYLALGVVTIVFEKAGVPWPWLLGLGVVGGLFLIRLFIFFHDCGHGSFWASRKVNMIWGFILGVLTFTPFLGWRKSHGIHHAHNGNLDRRGIGDVWTMTLSEYRSATPGLRRLYRFFRHPLFLFLLAPPLNFLLLHRISEKGAVGPEIRNLHLTNLGIVAIYGSIGWLSGGAVLLLYVLPALYVASVVGVWLFYVQHQFDPGYWEHEDQWDHFAAALRGSSFYRLPKWAQWFSGNIGFHHIHHLRPRIPNYRLEECFKAVQELQLPDPLTIRESLKGLVLHVWDEGEKRLLTFREAWLRLKTT